MSSKYKSESGNHELRVKIRIIHFVIYIVKNMHIHYIHISWQWFSLHCLKGLKLRVTFANIYGPFLNNFHLYMFEIMAFQTRKVQLGILGLELKFIGNRQLLIRSFLLGIGLIISETSAHICAKYLSSLLHCSVK